MTKKEILKIMKDSGYDTPEEVYGDFMTIIATAMRNGEDVVLDGIGKLLFTESKARDGRNPKTGEKIRISAKKGYKLKLGGKFKTELNS